MKKTVRLLFVLILMAVFGSPWGMAAVSTTSGPFTVGAEVTSSLTLDLTISRDDFAGTTVTAMDFGRLGPDTASGASSAGLRTVGSGMTAEGAMIVRLAGNSQGRPYTISQVGTPVTSGSHSLPSGALNVLPAYDPSDNAGATLPPGASLGSAGSWVGTRTLFSSGPTGALRTVQAIYAVTDDPVLGATASIPSSQPAGVYTGSVTFTITTA